MKIRSTFLAVFALGLSAWTVPLIASDSAAVRIKEFIYERAPFPECHASTIAEASDGTLVSAWFGGTREKSPDVGIWLARHEGGKWTAPEEVANGVQFSLADGTLARWPCWNPVLFQPRDEPLMLFYKVGPSPQEWWGMLTTSKDNGRTWSRPERLPDGILGPIKNKPVQLKDGTIFCQTSEELKPVGGAPSVWSVHFEVTKDLGRTWQKLGPVAAEDNINAIQPSLLFHADGRWQILCRSRQNAVATSWSTDQGRHWTPLKKSSLLNPNAGTDAVTLADGRQVIVYNPTVRDPNAPPGRSSGPRTPLVVAISPDGVEWTDVVTLENTPGEYSYPAVIQTKDGSIHITYSWNRERVRHVVLDPRKI